MLLELGDLGIGARAGFVDTQSTIAGWVEDMCVDAHGFREWGCSCRPGLLKRIPHVHVHNDGLPAAPDEAAGEEAEEQSHAVIPLGAAAGHVDFVEKPVDIKEWAGELIEDEGRSEVV